MMINLKLMYIQIFIKKIMVEATTVMLMRIQALVVMEMDKAIPTKTLIPTIMKIIMVTMAMMVMIMATPIMATPTMATKIMEAKSMKMEEIITIMETVEILIPSIIVITMATEMEMMVAMKRHY